MSHIPITTVFISLIDAAVLVEVPFIEHPVAQRTAIVTLTGRRQVINAMPAKPGDNCSRWAGG